VTVGERVGFFIKEIKMEIKEIEYSELGSTAFRNFKVGIKIATNSQDYQKDLAWLVGEVKQRLNEIISISKDKPKIKKAEK
jgi:hypothetical protein